MICFGPPRYPLQAGVAFGLVSVIVFKSGNLIFRFAPAFRSYRCRDSRYEKQNSLFTCVAIASWFHILVANGSNLEATFTQIAQGRL